ncbi:MAG: hypothetical protein O2942_09315 [Proteobacteria bacterium]|nr:hypothetical protein [Pseudomonadota bacterium]
MKDLAHSNNVIDLRLWQKERASHDFRKLAMQMRGDMGLPYTSETLKPRSIKKELSELKLLLEKSYQNEEKYLLVTTPIAQFFTNQKEHQ